MTSNKLLKENSGFSAKKETILRCEIGEAIDIEALSKENDHFTRAEVYGKEIGKHVSQSLNKSRRTIERAIQFAKTSQRVAESLGERILEEYKRFEQTGMFEPEIVQRVALDLGRSERTVYYAIQFARMFPCLEDLGVKIRRV